MPRFVALELAYEVISAVRAPLARIAAADGPLADHLRRALQSVALNLSEGSGRSGRDRTRHFRIARGSHLEARSCVEIALRLGYVATADVAEAERLAHRLGGLLWGLTRP